MVMMCMIVFEDAALFSSREFVSHFQTVWQMTAAVANTTEETAAISLQAGGLPVVISRMPVPLPSVEINEDQKTPFWLDAVLDLKRHRTHWIVAVSGTGGRALECARLLTRVVHSILATHPTSLGVLWGSQGHLVSSRDFQEQAVLLRGFEDPILLWVDIQAGWRPEGQKSGLSAGMTRGLCDFELMEFEATHAQESPQNLVKRLYELVAFALEKGKDIRDGDALLEEGHLRVRAVYSDSVFRHSQRAIRLEYQEKAELSWLAMESLVAAVLAALYTSPIIICAGASLTAIVCGHLGLLRIRRSAGKLEGRRVAWAGLAIAYTVLAFLVVRRLRTG